MQKLLNYGTSTHLGFCANSFVCGSTIFTSLLMLDRFPMGFVDDYGFKKDKEFGRPDSKIMGQIWACAGCVDSNVRI
jgi:hypothetical protein